MCLAVVSLCCLHVSVARLVMVRLHVLAHGHRFVVFFVILYCRIRGNVVCLWKVMWSTIVTVTTESYSGALPFFSA